MLNVEYIVIINMHLKSSSSFIILPSNNLLWCRKYNLPNPEKVDFDPLLYLIMLIEED